MINNPAPDNIIYSFHHTQLEDCLSSLGLVLKESMKRKKNENLLATQKEFNNWRFVQVD